ncbi:MAG: hypothetical protein IT370_21710 [Deltaproteobacteria bacterium]|nr:hypothetical protein [Deltaproteobacteria bacterium]
MTAGAAEHVVRDAYLQACRQYHPNRYARGEANARALALEVFIALKRAYEDLARQRARNGAGGPPAATPGLRLVAAAQPPGRVAQGTAPIGLPPRATTPPNGSPPRAATPPNGAPQRLGTAPAAAPVAVSPAVNPIAAARPLAQRPGQPSSAAVQKQREREERVQRALADSQAGRHGEARKVLYAVAAEDAQERRWRVLLYLVWGHELLAEGKLDEAQKQYERSLGLDASHEPTRRALAELDGKRKGKGFWKSFLGK